MLTAACKANMNSACASEIEWAHIGLAMRIAQSVRIHHHEVRSRAVLTVLMFSSVSVSHMKLVYDGFEWITDRDPAHWQLPEDDIQARRELFHALEMDDYWAVS
jgi:hypothetical protein